MIKNFNLDFLPFNKYLRTNRLLTVSMKQNPTTNKVSIFYVNSKRSDIYQ